VGSSVTYNLPTQKDDEVDTISITAYESGQSNLPVFVNMVGSALTISPNSNA
jgi:hypothetical protein